MAPFVGISTGIPNRQTPRHNNVVTALSREDRQVLSLILNKNVFPSRKSTIGKIGQQIRLYYIINKVLTSTPGELPQYDVKIDDVVFYGVSATENGGYTKFSYNQYESEQTETVLKEKLNA